MDKNSQHDIESSDPMDPEPNSRKDLIREITKRDRAFLLLLKEKLEERQTEIRLRLHLISSQVKSGFKRDKEDIDDTDLTDEP